MSKPAEPAAPPLRTWRPIALWSAAILLALGLVWFVGAVVVPVWQVRRALPHFPSSEAMWVDAAYKGYMYVPRLGPPEAAAHKLTIYIMAPSFVAPRKNLALALLRFCGNDGRRSIELFRKGRNPQLRLLASKVLCLFKDVDTATVAMEDLADPAPEIRGEAVRVLSWSLQAPTATMADATHAAAVDALDRIALGDRAPQVRSAAAEALKKIRGEGAKP